MTKAKYIASAQTVKLKQGYFSFLQSQLHLTPITTTTF